MKKILLSAIISAALLFVGSNITTVDAAVNDAGVSTLANSNKVVVKVTNPNGGRLYKSVNGSINIENDRLAGYNTEWVGIPTYFVVNGNTLLQWYQISNDEYVLASDVTVVGMA